MNFTSTRIRILPGYPLEITGPILQLLLAVDVPIAAAVSQPELIPQNHVVNIMLGATSALQSATGKVVAGITAYTVPHSSTVLPPHVPVSQTPQPHPQSQSQSQPTTSATVTSSPIPPTLRPPTAQEQEQNAIIVILGHATVEEVAIHYYWMTSHLLLYIIHPTYYDRYRSFLITQWHSDGQLQQAFKHTVAEQATSHCQSTPTACGILLEITRKW